MTTPLIPPPPAPPKKRTVNARLEESIFEDLKRYIVYAGGGDFSHVINKGLSMVFENDNGFRPWVAAHPGTISEPPRVPRTISRTQRHYVCSLCFHIHSGFVPSILVARTAVFAVRGSSETTGKPQTAEPAVCATKLRAVMHSSFVFIYILALFRRFRVTQTAAFAVRGSPR